MFSYKKSRCILLNILFFFFSLLTPSLLAISPSQNTTPNQLIHESSPYLLMHAQNPVRWVPWQKSFLQRAVDENKLIIVSIGYTSCHWCHVMEKESFSDPEVAEYMNEHFVSIKVDREERPDVDSVYMQSAQLMTGRGGWPLNIITLPNGAPVYAVTYLPKEKWIGLLKNANEYFHRDPEKMLISSLDLLLKQGSLNNISKTLIKPQYSTKDILQTFHNLNYVVDRKRGGFKGVHKFIMPNALDFILEISSLFNNRYATETIILTLDQISQGGIYDQLGGGFHRYSTDDAWKVPHFEKMLYDNAQLISLFSHAYQRFNIPRYEQTIRESILFVERELYSQKGAFYSSIGADSEGSEGTFYTWNRQDFIDSLYFNKTLLMDYFSITDQADMENGRHVLHRTQSDQAFAEERNISLTKLIKKINSGKNRLLKAREKRERPITDDKIITSWNGLMISAYCDAYNALSEPLYLKKAIRLAQFIKEHQMTKDYRLNRIYKDGKSAINAFLDDYATVIQGFIDLYQVTFDEELLNDAKHLTEYTLTHFFNDETGMFFYNSDEDDALLIREYERHDGVIPASNSMMAHNLRQLGEYFYDEGYSKKAVQMLDNVKKDMIRGTTVYTNWALLLIDHVFSPFSIAIVGEDALSFRQAFNEFQLPPVEFMGGKAEGSLPLLKHKLVKGQTTIYVCRHRVCEKPVQTVNDALEQLGVEVDKQENRDLIKDNNE